MSAATDRGLDAALAEIAAGASRRDAAGPVGGFPHEPFALLRRAGALGLTVGPRPVSTGEEWGAVRAVSRADASVGRIYDGHLNAVERIALLAPEPLRGEELAAVSDGERLLGVWGADPVTDEGEPARLTEGATLRGVKVFCSGAGGLDRAIVLVRAPDGSGPPLLAYVDLGSPYVEIDRAWFAGAGLRAAESHRVVFHDTPVLALLGEPGVISAEPVFSRDAIRTAAMWAGIADCAAAAALDALAARPERSELAGLAAARIATAHTTIDLYLAEATRRADAPELARFALELREAVTTAVRTLLDEAARALGSRPFATGSALDRARRDLELFLLQKRLDPLLARAGNRLLEGRA